MQKVVVLGSTNVDMVIAGKRIPVPGETVSDGEFMMNPGGKGANQAVAVARLSRHKGVCEFIAKVGDDLFGRETTVNMRRNGVEAKLLVDKTVASGTALIMVDSKGQNVISVAPGANGTLSPDDIAPYRSDIEGASVLLMHLETRIDTVLTAAEWAHSAGAVVILNPAPARKIPAKLFRLVDWITPNETEAEILTGVKVTDEPSAALATAALERKGVGHVLITMGARGVYCGRLYPARRVKAIDCVAAGDTFNGAFAVALAEGQTLDDAVAFSQRAAAISVTRRGAQASVPFRREIDV